MKANNTFGRREIMLVAHTLVRRFKQTLSESLRDAWRWFKSGNANFKSYLGMPILAKRKESLNNFSLVEVFQSQRNGSVTTIDPCKSGIWYWNEKYNVLFK